jgi:hypothetical protein
MPSILNNNACRIALVFFFTAVHGWSTSVVVAVTSAGIIVGTDSKVSNRSGSYGPIGEHDKFFIVQHRIIIVDVGAASITSPRDGSELYEFGAWMNELKSHIPANVTADRFANIIKAESAKKFAFVSRMMKSGDIPPEQPYELYDPLVRYIIAGYDSDTPKLYVVELDLDWNRVALIGPKLTLINLSNATGDFHLHFFGKSEAVADLTNRESYAYKQTMLRCPTAFGHLVLQTGVPISLNETSAIVGVLVEVEQRINPSSVGGIVRIVRVTPDGRANEECKRAKVLPKGGTGQQEKAN